MKEDNIHLKNLQDHQVLVVYGIGESNFFSQLNKWLAQKKERELIFIEDDEKIYENSKKIIDNFFSSKNTRTYLIKDLDESLKKIAWHCSYLNIKILKSSFEKREDNFNKISQSLSDLHLGINVTSYLYSDFGLKNFENVYNNLLNTTNFILLEPLRNKFKNIPAIILGAGPSLDQNINFLKDAFDKALIFVGGSALNVFSTKNIKYHFSGFIDPINSFKRFKNNHFFEDIFFYTNQMAYQNNLLTHSKNVLVSDFGAYPLERWIYNRLEIEQNIFEAGFNVTNFLIKIAALLGCNPIYFVGFDLCFKKEKYAQGVVKNKNLYEHIKVKNILNEDVFTQTDFLLAKKWVEEFAISNKNISFFNATQTGLKLDNIPNIKLDEHLSNLNTNKDLLGYVNAIYEQEKKISLEKVKVLEIFELILKSLDRSLVICEDYLIDMEKGIFDENLLKLQKEIIYLYLLDPLWQIWQYPILRKVEDDKIHVLINKLLFFKNVISKHLNQLRKILC